MSEPAASQSAIGTKRSGRIARRFRELGEASELGLVAYVTAGDPSLAATEKIVLAAAEAGADVIELGVPFSDPVADGPTIQRASDRALHSGTTLAGVIELVHKIRAHSDVPLILFTYFNPVLQMGLEKFAKDAASAGADGVLVTDLTPEEAEDYRATMQTRAGSTRFFWRRPLPRTRGSRGSPAHRVGFSILFPARESPEHEKRCPPELPTLVRRTRKFTSLPIAVGFGISLPTHVTVLGGIADAAVVGSAIMAEVEKASSSGEAAARAVGMLVHSLKSAARSGVSRRSSEAP